MKIGILGGTFDPVHNGHIVLAKKAAKKLKLDKVILVPAYIPVHKMRKTVLDPRHRHAMVKLAAKGNRLFSVSGVEITSKKPCYTVDTLRKLKNKYKGRELFFMTGSDSLPQLKKWKNIDEIFRLARFVIVKRPGFAVKSVPQDAIVLEIGALDISASWLRARIKKGRSIKGLVPAPVRRYIEKNKLYR